MAFATVALAELGLVFSVRSPIRPAWHAPRNPYLVGSVVLSAAVVAACVYWSALNDVIETVPLGGAELGAVVLLALVPFATVEAGKAVLRRAGWALGPAA
jgi:magnesium-transporting ATPase (P-type)